LATSIAADYNPLARWRRDIGMVNFPHFQQAVGAFKLVIMLDGGGEKEEKKRTLLHNSKGNDFSFYFYLISRILQSESRNLPG
jgi:hypothetical protein